ncbi:hypothetical protein LAZ40_09890 [Cereibacter sphaeroides]|uniref:hypothetical protein n=1 Tax=Cereibacter sphaeroides TaxID=1063 RepID=UPI001F431D6A|nr:hypothetical protein [Cereibacter sphaeroides]MCE6959362.1 hypothetical protein [Cereibacter sphaeroides]MCE6972954.1 hypothetical protein [Cereibacter sphaeroides]
MIGVPKGGFTLGQFLMSLTALPVWFVVAAGLLILLTISFVISMACGLATGNF